MTKLGFELSTNYKPSVEITKILVLNWNIGAMNIYTFIHSICLFEIECQRNTWIVFFWLRSYVLSLLLASSTAPQECSKLGSSGVIIGKKMFWFLCRYLILCDWLFFLFVLVNLHGMTNLYPLFSMLWFRASRSLEVVALN